MRSHFSSITTTHPCPSTTIKTLTFVLLALPVFLALGPILAPSYSYMTTLRSLFSSFTRSASVVPKMKHAPPPPPTVPTAIKAAEECAAGGVQEGTETATFAAGCFWGVEHLFNKHYGDREGWTCLSGYCGGDEEEPCEFRVWRGGGRGGKRGRQQAARWRFDG